MSDSDPNLKGNIAELKIAAEATSLGIPVLRPMAEHARYDLVFEVAGQFFRIQCKWASRKGDVITVRMITNRRGPNGLSDAHTRPTRSTLSLLTAVTQAGATYSRWS